jgi:hypothetical protein
VPLLSHLTFLVYRIRYSANGTEAQQLNINSFIRMARFKLKGWQPIFQAQALQACRQELKGGIKMKKSLMALLMGIALMA